MAIIIALTNQKGGVGKTTSSCALATGLAAKHKKVLCIDLDPQGNLGFSLGLDIDNCSSIYEVLKGDMHISEIIHPTKYCDVITSNILLSSAEVSLPELDRELCLLKALTPIRDNYDYIIIDTPPALNILTVNAYAASNHLIIPMIPEILSLLGLVQLQETIDSVKSTVNPNLNILGILFTRFNSRNLLAQEVLEMATEVATQIPTCVFDTKIRSSVVVAEAPAHGESLYDYSPRSNPVKDYESLVNEVLAKIQASQLEVKHGS